MALMVIAVMLQAEAPRAPLDYKTIVAAVKGLGYGGTIAVAGLALAISVTLLPLQFRLVQIIEGYWSLRAFPWLFRLGVWRQRRRLRRVEADLTVRKEPMSEQQRLLRTGRRIAAESIVRTHFPSEDRLLPTSLGNVLRSAEERAGLRYGLDSIVIWPRLFPLLPKEYAQGLEDEVTQLDMSVRLTVTWALAGAIAAWIICSDPASARRHPAWLIVVAGLFVLSRMSYRAAIESALAHGQDVEVTLDLYRDRVLEGTRMPEPRHLVQERRIFNKLCQFLSGEYDEKPEFDIQYRTPCQRSHEPRFRSLPKGRFSQS